jgi:hypothetical protein
LAAAAQADDRQHTARVSDDYPGTVIGESTVYRLT